MNYLLDFDRLSNRYHAMRHGHSIANQRGIIVSHPTNGCGEYGLSERGKSQLRQSLEAARHLDASTVIVSSDFRRAQESAELARAELKCDQPIRLEPGLRERNFGKFELGPDSAYDEIWRQDAQDPSADFQGVETVFEVMARVTEVITILEQSHQDTDILLVSHGDALQILQTAFAGLDASTHRQQSHLQTAEIRQLLLA